MSKIIEIVVDPKGVSKIETKGFAGAGCQQASAAFEAALGAKTSDNMTAEYYAETNSQQIEATN